VISERAEKTALILTTNLPFREWTTVFLNPRLYTTLLDRVTDRAHIIETGPESFRFPRTRKEAEETGGIDQRRAQLRAARRKTAL
jgi:DNA replication protein DnaC